VPAYPIDNALFQWEDGERRVKQAPDRVRRVLERAIDRVLEELRRRLGSSFSMQELADLYANDVDWATELVREESFEADAAGTAAAAFNRYAREASDYAGGGMAEGGRE